VIALRLRLEQRVALELALGEELAADAAIVEAALSSFWTSAVSVNSSSNLSGGRPLDSSTDRTR
jgi:hypothetical protein